MASWELLRLGHTAREVEIALRTIQCARIRETAMSLAGVMKDLRKDEVEDQDLNTKLFALVNPLITLLPCRGLIPRAC